ncbi:MAG TPA: hypothetical protein V6C65_32085, partial [Allocoleopsis sp.]
MSCLARSRPWQTPTLQIVPMFHSRMLQFADSPICLLSVLSSPRLCSKPDSSVCPPQELPADFAIVGSVLLYQIDR